MPITNRDIYNNALSLIGETLESNYLEDYEERAPYIIASVASQTKAIDKRIRLAEGLESAASFSPVFLSLDLDFPLCEQLTFPAALYLASLLVIDEDPDLSVNLYDKYCDTVSSLQTAYTGTDTSSSNNSGGAAVCESIAERYFFD